MSRLQAVWSAYAGGDHQSIDWSVSPKSFSQGHHIVVNPEKFGTRLRILLT